MCGCDHGSYQTLRLGQHKITERLDLSTARLNRRRPATERTHEFFECVVEGMFVEVRPLQLGQVVFHLHMHVMPRHNGVALLPPASRKEEVKVLEDNATKLAAALGSAHRQ